MRIPLSATTALGVAAATGLLLLVPLVAMRFTDEVRWDLGDFLAGGALIFAAGLALAMGLRRVRTGTGRAVVATSVVAVLLVVWAELAVGLFA